MMAVGGGDGAWKESGGRREEVPCVAFAQAILTCHPNGRGRYPWLYDRRLHQSSPPASNSWWRNSFALHGYQLTKSEDGILGSKADDVWSEQVLMLCLRSLMSE